MNPGRARGQLSPHRENSQKEKNPVTEYKLNRFTMADAQALVSPATLSGHG